MNKNEDNGFLDSPVYISVTIVASQLTLIIISRIAQSPEDSVAKAEF